MRRLPRTPAVSDSDCQFCQIADGARLVAVVARGPDWIAFFPEQPATVGHTIVIPTSHVQDLWENKDVLASVMPGVWDVGRAIRASLRPDGMNCITSAGEAAEQSVPHLHIHVVPRRFGDDFGKIWPPKQSIDPEALESAMTRIQRELPSEGDE